jgi:hypothetical protein
MSYRPGDSYHGQFTTQRADTGRLAEADALPLAVATRNGADDAAFSLTIAMVAPGRYAVAGTIPAGYQAGDTVQVVALAAVGGVEGAAVIDRFVLDTRRVGDLRDFDPATQPVAVSHLAAAALAELFTADPGVTFEQASEASVVRQIAAHAACPPAGDTAADGGWTTDEKRQIRRRLGLDGEHATPAAGGDLPDIKTLLQSGTHR